jgi:hypothetical protein
VPLACWGCGICQYLQTTVKLHIRHVYNYFFALGGRNLSMGLLLTLLD